MFPTENTMPQEDTQNLNDVFTTMATGAIPTDAEDYTASEDIMDISSMSYAPITTHQHAIPTSVITPTSLNNAGWLGANQNSIHGGSFIPPAVSSSNNSYTVVTSRPSNGIVVNTMPRSIVGGRVVQSVHDLDIMRIGGTGGRRRIKDDELTPEERSKRRVRRERNKLAAAKCRQRRVDHTNTLVEQTEDWEEKNATLEQEISKLNQQKEQLEFILEAHKAMCSKLSKAKECGTTTTTSSTSTSLDTPVTEVVTPTSVFNSLSSYEVLVPGDTMDTSHNDNRESSVSAAVNGNAPVSIKREPEDLSSPEPKRTLLSL